MPLLGLPLFVDIREAFSFPVFPADIPGILPAIYNHPLFFDAEGSLFLTATPNTHPPIPDEEASKPLRA